ncbi:MAG: SRPBCC domain-containing protein [Chthonomonadaceae bacterium]|nr:SRPBCC domain-containing protein [Chthonomonadaceae bacterium]
MKVTNTPDNPVTDAACKSATGKTLQEWFKELDAYDGLKKGRRDSTNYMYDKIGTKDAWWPTTIYVEYEAHHGVKKKDGFGEGYSICCTKGISAPVDKVYATWTDAGKFKEMFGDNGRQDVKEGGEIACEAGCKATFTRVRPDKDLRFTWEHPGCTMPMQVDVMFQDNKGKCLMNVMTSRIQTRDEADGLRNAWSEALTRLKSLSEA